MKRRGVKLTDRAKLDLRQLHRYIASRGAPRGATAYVERIRSFILSLELAAERGTPVAVAGVDLRTIPFESVVIAVLIEERTVTVIRVYHSSQDWLTDLSRAAGRADD